MSFLYCFYEFFVILFWVFFILWVFCCLFWVFCYLFLSFFFSSNIFLQLNEFFDQICQIFTKKLWVFCLLWVFLQMLRLIKSQNKLGQSGHCKSVWKFKLGDNCKKMVEIVDSSNFFFSSSSSFISQKGQNRPLHASMCQFLPVHKKVPFHLHVIWL